MDKIEKEPKMDTHEQERTRRRTQPEQSPDLSEREHLSTMQRNYLGENVDDRPEQDPARRYD
jgi:hypothetical protein